MDLRFKPSKRINDSDSDEVIREDNDQNNQNILGEPGFGDEAIEKFINSSIQDNEIHGNNSDPSYVFEEESQMNQYEMKNILSSD